MTAGEVVRYRTASDVAVAHFRATGWLLTRTLDDAGVNRLQQWVEEVSSRPDRADGVLHYREQTDTGPALCRTENFIASHPGFRALLTVGPMLEVASALLDEPALLYKEKINYKLPGGAGYSPHQDAPAYRFVDIHVSCMVAVDDATVGNGCLEVVSAAHNEVLPTDERGCIRPDIVATFEWMPVEVVAGDTLWFHSWTPHRSGANTSSTPRRAIYPTYNAASEGDLHDDYYRQKLAEFAAAGESGDRVQVSLIGDFEGRPVT